MGYRVQILHGSLYEKRQAVVKLTLICHQAVAKLSSSCQAIHTLKEQKRKNAKSEKTTLRCQLLVQNVKIYKNIKKIQKIQK